MSPTTMAGRPASRGHPQVDDVAVEQVDLGRAAGALAENDVVAGPEIGQLFQDQPGEGRLGPLVVGRVEGLPRPAHDDDLAGAVGLAV